MTSFDKLPSILPDVHTIIEGIGPGASFVTSCSWSGYALELYDILKKHLEVCSVMIKHVLGMYVQLSDPFSLRHAGSPSSNDIYL